MIAQLLEQLKETIIVLDIGGSIIITIHLIYCLLYTSSTDSGTSGALVECVSSDGNIVNHNCKCLYCGDLGVRPYFIIDSSTLVNVN